MDTIFRNTDVFHAGVDFHVVAVKYHFALHAGVDDAVYVDVE